jgi:hypothetical protein
MLESILSLSAGRMLFSEAVCGLNMETRQCLVYHALILYGEGGRGADTYTFLPTPAQPTTAASGCLRYVDSGGPEKHQIRLDMRPFRPSPFQQANGECRVAARKTKPGFEILFPSYLQYFLSFLNGISQPSHHNQSSPSFSSTPPSPSLLILFIILVFPILPSSSSR